MDEPFRQDILTLTIHCQVYWPDNSAVSQMITAVAEDAARAGFAVTVITSANAYNLEDTFALEEVHERVRILRVGGARWNRHRVWGRLANYLNFVLRSGFKLFQLPAPDCLVVTSVPPFSLMPACLLRAIKKVPFVYVVEDLYPDIAIESGLLRRNSFLTRLVMKAFGWMMRRAQAIVVLGAHMKRRVLASHPRIRPESVHQIDNWHDGTLLFPLGEREAVGRPVCFQYSGNLGEAHDVETLLQAMSRLRHRSDLVFQFVGRGKRRPDLEQQAHDQMLANCQFQDYVPLETLNESLNQADVCLVSLRKGYEGLIVPSKIYGIMAVGKPVLYIGAKEGEIPDLIHQWRMGWVVEQGDVEGLVRAIEEATARPDLRQEYGRNAHRSFQAHYDRPLATAKYVRVFEEVANRPARFRVNR